MNKGWKIPNEFIKMSDTCLGEDEFCLEQLRLLYLCFCTTVAVFEGHRYIVCSSSQSENLFHNL